MSSENQEKSINDKMADERQRFIDSQPTDEEMKEILEELK